MTTLQYRAVTPVFLALRLKRPTMVVVKHFIAVSRKIGLGISLVLTCWNAGAALDQTQKSPSNTGHIALQQAIQEYVDREIAENAAGFAVGVVVDGEVLMTNTGGFREHGVETTIDADTVFRLASVSKTFTSGLVASLPGLDWDVKLNDYLSDINLSRKDYQQALSLRHLLSHTSGLMPHAYTNLVQDNVPYQKIVRRLDRVDFVCPPGRCYGYQNVVYNLAGDMIAAKEKASYESLVESRLFDPLAMHNSSFGLKAFKDTENRATPHRWDKVNQRWLPITVRENYYQLAPAAGVNSSLNDMIRWLRLQLGQFPEVIDPSALKAVHTPQVRTTRRLAHYVPPAWNGVENTHYALGWRTFDFNGEEGFLHHGGWVAGVRTEMAFNPRLNMGIVYLSNSASRHASEVVPVFLRLYFTHILSRALTES
ncbi:beta-lactamase family protein [Exilibacterium tricleocarpae]|uniref:Beta-lactamase family protein n=1 Tax=Exilibacterium tricleocarpae TaxID=2591008 RepID=A0A545TZE1_9GAMM|nr:serine hydrolase domain-containing protein [Exilibacterium tricleocarpae]TQV82584.1 beta-lactamase family protein [Exilibacterium tricleocarpae]